MAKKIQLNLGCFNKKMHGFTNIDIRKDVNPDVVDDILTLSTFENDSVDLIYACHVLEHFSREQSLDALRRWKQVLKIDGKLRISVPDIQATCEHYVCYKDLDLLKCLFYGSQKHEYDFHYTGWDFQTLKRDLLQVGFVEVYEYSWQKTEHAHVDDYSQAYLPHMDKIHGKLMSLNVEATK